MSDAEAIQHETIGSYVKEKRLELNIGLRDFLEATGFNPMVWSAIEKDMTYIKVHNGKIDKIADVLKIEKDSLEYIWLCILALKSQATEYPKLDVEEYAIKNRPAFHDSEAAREVLRSHAKFINELNGYTE